MSIIYNSFFEVYGYNKINNENKKEKIKENNETNKLEVENKIIKINSNEKYNNNEEENNKVIKQ